MSTDPNLSPRIRPGTNEDARRESYKSNASTSAKVTTSDTSMEEDTTPPVDYSYFSANPAAYPLRPGTTSRRSPTPSGGESDNHVSPPEKIHLPRPTGRPGPHSIASTSSMQSTDSSVTVTAATANARPPTSHPSIPPMRPSFPDQSYAALHSQQYPTPHVPPTLRQRNSHPGQVLTFTSAFAALHPTGTKTAGNSPAPTPGNGLFDPHFPKTPGLDTPKTLSTYASPFLHFTSRAVPKETHVADVEFDPNTGRKVINHYEIMDELGRGTHGKVKLGRDLQKEDTYVAIKIVERFSKRRKLGRLGTTEDKVKKEVAILKKARHPNIVALLEVIDDPSRKKVYIVLEWVERGEIHWRAESAREVAIVEAWRYERGKRGLHDAQSQVEEAAIFEEAQRLLDKQHRRAARALRRKQRDQPNMHQAWSIELGRDGDSDLSDDDRMSHVSTATQDSQHGKHVYEELRRASKVSTPLQTTEEEVLTPTEETEAGFAPPTEDLDDISPTTTKTHVRQRVRNGLEGTMYGPYDPSSGESTRVNSMSAAPPKISPKNAEALKQMAAEIMRSDLDTELKYVPVMTMGQIRVAFRDTLLGLQYLHYQNIIHRDIKPPNLLATKDYRVKISDFGVSYLGRPIHDGEPSEDVSEHEAQDLDDEAKELAKTVGTPAFYAPELCITDSVEEQPPITKAIDVWALGVTLFCMLFARTPFVGNEFYVMRQIADEEIYIPTKRLAPVPPKPHSRPSSQPRNKTPVVPGSRHPMDLIYEDLGEELHDLLRRLLTKDSKKRVTLEEVRHHPWVVADLPDKIAWLEETDPSRQSQGKKIEVSKEDVNSAVVPLFDRVKSVVKKAAGSLGFGGGNNKSLRRSHTSTNTGAGFSPSPAHSAASSSTNVSTEGRRYSLRGDEQIFSALKQHRDEHPLSRIVASRPDDAHTRFFDIPGTRPESAVPTHGQIDPIVRPTPPERPSTAMGASGSMRTVKQSDFLIARAEESRPTTPPVIGIPDVVESPQTGQNEKRPGVAKRVLRTLREKGSVLGSENRATSSERDSIGSHDTHGEPSIALSQATASGHVNPPAAFDDFGPRSNTSSRMNSPTTSRTPSLAHSPSADISHLVTERGSLSRHSSINSLQSAGRRLALQGRAYSRSPTRHGPQTSRGSMSDAEQRTEDEHVRQTAKPTSHPSPFTDQHTNPFGPSQPRRTSAQILAASFSHPSSPHSNSPLSHGPNFPPTLVSSTSDFGSAVSMSVSDPSIPSVVSETSSIDHSDDHDTAPLSNITTPGFSTHPQNKRSDPPADSSTDIHLDPVTAEPFDPSDPLARVPSTPSPPTSTSSDSDPDTDSDGGLVMTSRRTPPKNGSVTSSIARERSGPSSLSTPSDETPIKPRRRAGSSGRRGGSQGTVERVRSMEEGEDGRDAEGKDEAT